MILFTNLCHAVCFCLQAAKKLHELAKKIGTSKHVIVVLVVLVSIRVQTIYQLTLQVEQNWMAELELFL